MNTIEFKECYTKDEMLQTIKDAIEECKNMDPPNTDPHVAEIEDFISNVPIFFDNGIGTNKKLFERYKVLNDPAAAKIRKFYAIDVWKLAFYYTYAYWIGNSDETDLNVIEEKYNAIKELTYALKDELDKFSYYDFARHVSVLFALAGAADLFSSGWTDNPLPQEDIDKIIEFLRNDSLSQEEIDAFLKQYENKKLVIKELASLKEVEDSVESKYPRDSLARVIEKFKSSKNLNMLMVLISIFKSGDTSYLPVLAMKTEMYLNYAGLDFANSMSCSDHQKACTLAGFFFDKYSNRTLLGAWAELENYCRGTKAAIDNALKEKNKSIVLYKTVYNTIKNIGENDFIDDALARKLFKNIVYAEEMHAVTFWIFQHNYDLIKRESEKNEKLKKDHRRQLIKMLSEFCIPLSDDILGILEDKNLEELKKVLYKLKRYFSPSEIAYILFISSFSIIERICSYLKEDYLELDFVKKHMSLFDCSKNTLSSYEEVLEVLKRYRINPRQFKELIGNILENIELFKNNMVIISKYGLLQSLRKTTKIPIFILDDNITDKIDKIIEAGCYDHLVNDLSLLSLPIDRFKRLNILQGMNIPLTSNPEDDVLFIGSVLNGSFFASDEQLDDYIVRPDVSEKDKQLNISTDDLEKYIVRKHTPVLMIGDCYFSYPKVVRKMNEGLSFVEALFYNRSCTQEMYEEMMDDIRPVEIEKTS